MKVTFEYRKRGGGAASAGEGGGDARGDFLGKSGFIRLNPGESDCSIFLRHFYHGLTRIHTDGKGVFVELDLGDIQPWKGAKNRMQRLAGVACFRACVPRLQAKAAEGCRSPRRFARVESPTGIGMHRVGDGIHRMVPVAKHEIAKRSQM